MVLPLILFLVYFAYSWDDSSLANGYLGGYFNMTEITAQLNSFNSSDLSLFTLGKTVNGNNIEGIKLLKAGIYYLDGISSSLRQKILITGCHTTSQPLSATQVLYLLNLMTNDTDADTLYLAQTTEIYFIPVINVDAYTTASKDYSTSKVFTAYLKNSKNTCKANVTNSGVDLNRNFNSHWGIDDNGSSNDTCNDTYRGESAFSEPETSALKSFIESAQNLKMWIHYDSYGNQYIYPYSYTSKDNYLAYKNISSLNYFRYLPTSAILLSNVTYGSYYDKNLKTINGANIDYGMDNNIYSFGVSIGTQNTAQADILTTCRFHANIFKQIALTIGPLIKIEFYSITEEICIKNETCTNNENAYAHVNLKYLIRNLGLSDSYGNESLIFKATYGSSYSYEITDIVIGSSATTLSYKNISDSAYNISIEVNMGSIVGWSSTTATISFYSYKGLSYDGEEMTINYLAKLTSSLTETYSALSASDSSVAGNATQPSTTINTENYDAFYYYLRVSSDHNELAAVITISIFMGLFMIAIWVLIIKIYKNEQLFGNHNSEPRATMADLHTRNVTVESTLRKPENNLNGFSPNGFEIKSIGKESIKFGFGPYTGEGSPSQRGKISIPNSPPKARENFGEFREVTLEDGSPSSFGGIRYGMPRADIKHDIENPVIRSARQESLNIPMRSGLISKNEPEIKGNINVPGFSLMPPEIEEDFSQRRKNNIPPHMRGISFGKDPPSKLEIVDAPQLPIFARSPIDFSAKKQERQGFSPMYDAEDLQPSFGSPQAKAGGFGENIVKEPKLPFASSQFKGSTGIIVSGGPAFNQVSTPPNRVGGISLGNPNSKGTFQPISDLFGEDFGDIEILVDENK